MMHTSQSAQVQGEYSEGTNNGCVNSILSDPTLEEYAFRALQNLALAEESARQLRNALVGSVPESKDVASPAGSSLIDRLRLLSSLSSELTQTLGFLLSRITK